MSDPYFDGDQEPSTRIFDTNASGVEGLTSASERTSLGGSGGPMAQPQSPGCLKMGMWGAAIVLAVLFVLTTPAVMFMFTMERIAFDPATYKRALIQVDFYEQLPGLVATEMSESFARNPQENAALANLSKPDIQAIVTGLITKEWAKEQTESVIDQGFAWLESDSPTVSIKVSMAGIKKELSGPQGQTAAMTVINSWPPCTETQVLAATAAVALGNTQQMPLCRPPDELMPSITPYFGDMVAEGAKTIPDEIDLAAPDGVSRPVSPEDDPRPGLKTFRAVAFFSPLIPALLLLGIAVFAVRSWKTLGTWWGIPLLISGILGGIVAVSMLPLRNIITESLIEDGTSVAASFEQIFTGVFGYVFETGGWWIGGEAALLVVGGGGLILFGYLMARSEPRIGSSLS